MATLEEELLLLKTRVEALATGYAEELTAFMESALETVQGRVLLLAEKADETASLVRRKNFMQKQIKEIEDVLSDVYSKLEKDTRKKITKEAREFPELIHEAHRRALPASVLGGAVVPKLTTNRMLSWFEAFEIEGRPFHDWITGNSDTVKKETIKAARESLLTGESKKDAVRRLNKKIEVGVQRSRQLIQDATHGAHSYAEEVYHEQNKDLINLYRFSAEMDGRTCPQCADKDGEIWNDPADVDRPPIHRLCRCWISTSWIGQKLEGDKPARFSEKDGWIRHKDGTRSTRWKPRGAEQVPRDLKYKDWVQGLATSSNPAEIATAKEILGKTRFNLVRDGKLSVEKLYHNGKRVTIKDLKRKYNL